MSVARDTSLHELRHVFAAAVAAIATKVSRKPYHAAVAHTDVQGGHGECAIEWPDDFDHARAVQIAQLSAYGPAAAADDVMKLCKSGSVQDLVDAGNLSPPDLDLIRAFDGPPTLPLMILLAVQAVEKRLGFAGTERLAKVLRDVTNHQCDPLMLSDFLPYQEAEAALAAAKASMDAAFHVETPVERINRKTRDEASVAKFKSQRAAS